MIMSENGGVNMKQPVSFIANDKDNRERERKKSISVSK